MNPLASLESCACMFEEWICNKYQNPMFAYWLVGIAYDKTINMSCTPIENMVLVHNAQEKQCFERISVMTCIIIPPILKVSTKANIWNRYNQVPHLTSGGGGSSKKMTYSYT